MQRVPVISPLHQSANTHPQAVAISWRSKGLNTALSYLSLSQRVICLGEQLLAAGLTRGDRLACIDNNSVELIMLYWACIDQGILFCPLSPRFPQTQLTELVERYALSHVWAGELHQDLLSQDLLTHTKLVLAIDMSLSSDSLAKSIDAKLPVNIILTSGSIGQPKAALHSLNNHIENAEGSRCFIPLQSSDSWLLTLPMFHIGGLAIINRCVLAGASVVLQDRESKISEQLARDKITHLSLVSTQLIRLLKQDPSSLKLVKALLLGGGAISSTLLAQLKTLNVPSFTSYGMTEMGSQITTGYANEDGSSGHLLPGRELKIQDNKIYVRGKTLFLGYLTPHPPEHSVTDPQTHALTKNEKQITLPVGPDGWFFTKDRGYWNDDGNLCILGRCDNMFISGGENIQPEEIEAILKQHPEIEEAIIFPLAHDEFGNLPAAIIKGYIPQQSELDTLVCSQAARFKRPRQYYLWPEVEQTSLKISRKQIIEAVLGKELGS
ncbi:o-succinylbenzoate--CoA ligase [Shewanella violacea]|uniref:O-succinylbenzoate--CoA ligase n=1 Tax=Shewanella violacea (strain JCM 10179 / CIP 106290 / LMG 19151 / DSS12) TaxID=637905 RepID=D4ZEF8_SHEVD|nr:o-succinylbenzoate--CoA ligase [Shewanella violacea]BAJ00188.1 O-succinylbenzoate--CoA ligase [Shewanella violacea DSS12]